MFPKFICVFTHRHGRGWHGDWAGKSKWGFRGFLTTHVPPVRFLGNVFTLALLIEGFKEVLNARVWFLPFTLRSLVS